MYLSDAFGDHILDELRFYRRWLIVELVGEVITADHAFDTERIGKGIVFAVHIHPCAFVGIGPDTELLVHVEPGFDIAGDLLTDVAVHLHITVNDEILAFQFHIFFHAVPPLLRSRKGASEVDGGGGRMDNAHHIDSYRAVETELLGNSRHLIGGKHNTESEEHIAGESKQSEE